MTSARGLRILHCLRAPVGGLFRHVCDLAAAQQARGHEVAVACAASGDDLTQQRLDALAQRISGGVQRITMSRNPGLADLLAVRHVRRIADGFAADIIHGHGAKGGAYARLAADGSRRHQRIAVYTPHGGSLHYPPSTLSGRAVAATERYLERSSAGIIFESRYSHDRYAAQIGKPRVPVRIIANGVGDADFEPWIAGPDASDIVFVGELRHLKGVDVLIDALALMSNQRPLTLTIVGSGPDRAAFDALVAARGLAAQVRFVGPMPARQAFRLGRVLVMPSRAESFPYIVLEAGAAGLPQILTRVGGIPEIIGDTGVPMLPPDRPEALATALFEHVAAPAASDEATRRLRARVRERFTIDAMCASIDAFYADLTELAQRAAPGRLAIVAD